MLLIHRPWEPWVVNLEFSFQSITYHNFAANEKFEHYCKGSNVTFPDNLGFQVLPTNLQIGPLVGRSNYVKVE